MRTKKEFFSVQQFFAKKCWQGPGTASLVALR